MKKFFNAYIKYLAARCSYPDCMDHERFQAEILNEAEKILNELIDKRIEEKVYPSSLIKK